jgi:hypothetical protein
VLNNLERIQQRVARRGVRSVGKFQTITRTYSLTSKQDATYTVDFPQGAVIISSRMAATETNKAAADHRGGLDMVRVGFNVPGQDTTLTPGGPVSAAALYGQGGSEQWPEQEIIIARQATLEVRLVNLTTSTLDVDILFNVLLPG